MKSEARLNKLTGWFGLITKNVKSPFNVTTIENFLQPAVDGNDRRQLGIINFELWLYVRI